MSKPLRSNAVRSTVVLGGVSALVGLVLRLRRARKRRREAAAEQAFTRASDGLWPPVPRAPERPVHIETDIENDTQTDIMRSASRNGSEADDATRGDTSSDDASRGDTTGGGGSES